MPLQIHPWKLREAARAVLGGGIIAYPTEAVYGLGCHPLDRQAVQRILDLKQRSMEKGLILIAADFSQLQPYVDELPEIHMNKVMRSWPGPHTWLFPAVKSTPSWLSGKHNTLAIRVTAHPIAATLCRICNTALVSTSANPSGLPPALDALTLRRYFSNHLDCIINTQLGGAEKPTSIQDALTGYCVR